MIKTLPISKLKTNTGQIEGLPKNPRFIRDERYEKLKKSIKDLPSMLELRELIVVPQNGHFVTIGGNMRLRAAKDLGLTELPCKVLDKDIAVETLAEIAIKDNVGFGQDDADILANEWTDFPLTDWGMELPGFEAIEEPQDAEPQIDKAAELNKKWKVKSGDLWQIGQHRLLCGDSTKRGDVERLLNGTLPEFGFADPPYNLNIDYGDETDDAKTQSDYEEFSSVWFALFNEFVTGTKVVTPGIANIGLWHLGNKPDWVAAWVKMNGQSRNKFGGTNKWEPVLCWDVPYDQGIDVFQVNNEYGEKLSNGFHPVSKPTELLNTIIGRFEGQTVFDPFTGCGTSLIACQNLNRKCYAIEISENYCAVILERMQTAFPDIEIKRET